MKTIEPTSGFLVVKLSNSHNEMKTDKGILIPKANITKTYEVIASEKFAVGLEVLLKGYQTPIEFEEGDTLFVVSEEDVIGIVK